jgi:hypothetical protein
MTDEQTQYFRHAILNTLLAGDCGVGLGVNTIVVGVRALGFPKATADETLAHVQYLADHGFASVVPKEINRVLRSWRISDDGRRYADEHGI